MIAYGKEHFRGVWITTITPIGENDEVLKATLLSHYQYISRNGIAGNTKVNGIIPLSPLGEFPSLTYQEKIDIIRAYGQEGGRTKIMPCIGETSPKQAIRLVNVVETAGLDGILLLPPYYYRPQKQELVVDYFKEVLKSTKLPIFVALRDPFSDTTVNYSATTRLQEFPNFYGIIDGSLDSSILKKSQDEKADFLVLSATEQRHAQSIMANGNGIISWLGNAYPRIICQLYEHFRLNQTAEAQEIQKKISSLLDLLNKYPLIDALKYAVIQAGFPQMITRLPLPRLTEDQKSKLKTDLKRFIGTQFGELCSDHSCTT